MQADLGSFAQIRYARLHRSAMRAGRLAVAEPSGLGRVVVGRAGQGIGRDIQQIVGEGVDRRRKRRWRRRVQPVQQDTVR